MHERGNPTRVSITDDAHPLALLKVAGLLRNQWPLSPGIPGRLAAEYALRQANEILRKASAYFAQAELDRRFKP